MIRIALSFDQEWCPTEVLEWLKAMLGDSGVKATIFATDEPVVDFSGQEVAIHPNPFREGSRGMEEEIGRLLEIYPQARGLRMHRLAWDTALEKALDDSNLDYVSNCLIPNQLVRPYILGKRLIHVPIFYMDHHELHQPQAFQPPFSVQSLALRENGLYVFDFHPNMLFSNANSEEYYRRVVHPAYHDPEAIAANRNKGRGCLSLFEELLGLKENPRYKFCTIQEALNDYRSRDLVNG